MKWTLLSLVLATYCWSSTFADLPVECYYSDIVGEWQFFETERNGRANINCNGEKPYAYVKNITLEFPNTAHDEAGNVGTWTMIYDQGFEVRIAGRSYFAFSKFVKKDGKITSECGLTFHGWARDFTIRNWSCYIGKKLLQPEPRTRQESTLLTDTSKYVQDEEMVKQINEMQDQWTAQIYPQFEGLRVMDMYRKSGAQTLKRSKMPKKTSSIHKKLQAAMLPRDFDWRNVDGENFVRPVKNQGECGSCYAFASIGILESQMMIHSNNNVSLDLSAQDIVGCSRLSQGCDGGFPYLSAGRYPQEHGIVEASCLNYETDDKCDKKQKAKCKKYYTMEYGYVGGYFGACNEDEMMLDLVNNGPMAVGIEVNDAFVSYKSGIFSDPTKKLNRPLKFNPFEETNHAVMLVGYGVSDKGVKYWTIQNSWGTDWGMDGFANILRGTDEIGIESTTMKAQIFS